MVFKNILCINLNPIGYLALLFNKYAVVSERNNASKAYLLVYNRYDENHYWT